MSLCLRFPLFNLFAFFTLFLELLNGKFITSKITLMGQVTIWLRHLEFIDEDDIINIFYTFLVLGMTSLKELDLSRCSKITDAGLKHVLSIKNLEKLCISETRLTADGVILLSSLSNLRLLDVGGIPVTDKALSSLQVTLYLSVNHYILYHWLSITTVYVVSLNI